MGIKQRKVKNYTSWNVLSVGLLFVPEPSYREVNWYSDVIGFLSQQILRDDEKTVENR